MGDVAGWVPADRRQAVFDRLVQEMVTDRPVSCRVERAPFVVWRWWAVLLVAGVEVDQRLCLTRRGAGRRAGRMVAEECARVDADLARLAADLFGGPARG